MRARPLARRGELIDMRVRFRADDLHVVAALVSDAVGSDAIVIGRGRFQPRDAHLNDAVVDLRGAIATTFESLAVAQVGTAADDDESVGHITHGEGDADARLGIVLQHGSRDDEGDVFC